jgi:putative transposase
MGKRYRTLIEGPSLFFVTTSTLNRQNKFIDEKSLHLVQDELFKTAEIKAGYLMGYVIMPNHIHLLIGFNDGGKGLFHFIHSFKGAVRKLLVANNLFWERGFDDFEIKTAEQFKIKLEYIHNNPVKRGLVNSPEDWPFSSYRFWEIEASNPYLKKDFSWMKVGNSD